MNQLEMPKSSILSVRIAGIISFIGIVAVNAMGFVDHDTKSGMGCGANWPLCHGSIIPSFTNEAVVIEYVHRVLTAGFVIALVVFFIGILWHSRYSHAWAQMAKVLAALLVAETVICTAGVLWHVPSAIMAWLAPIGLAAQGVLLVMVFRLWSLEPGKDSTGPDTIRRQQLLRAIIVAMIGYLYAGAWLSYARSDTLSLILYFGTGILLALGTIVWIGYTLRRRQRRGWEHLMWPLIASPFITHFSRPTVGGDLMIFAWLSWCTGIVAYQSLNYRIAHREVANPSSRSMLPSDLR